MKEFEMRTLLASAMLAAVAPAFAHGGHGETDFHWHGGDLLALLAMGVAVGVWLWRRKER
jgi:hypothetical protein